MNTAKSDIYTDILLEPAMYAQTFLNDLGGDFKITIIDNEAFLRNENACSGQPFGEGSKCDNVEKALNRALTTFHSDLRVDLVKCACEEGSSCEFRIIFDR